MNLDKKRNAIIFVLASMKTPIGLLLGTQLLMHLNVMSTDTGSTNNTISSMIDANNIKKYKDHSTKLVTNHNMLIFKSVVDFTATITDLYGHKKETALLHRFMFIPSTKYI